MGNNETATKSNPAMKGKDSKPLSAYEAYKKAVAPADEVYEKARALADEAYGKAIALEK